MSDSGRRDFLKRGAAGVAGLALADRASQAGSVNDRIVMGVIGCGGRGQRLGRLFQEQANCTVTSVCDPDGRRRAAARQEVRADHAVADLRRILDDSAVDAVAIATCDHWHAPAAVLACQAGKHVYVEKPCSHNVREGRLMVEAARRHERVMQHGTQRRSGATEQKAIQLLREGTIGRVLVAKHVNSQKRADIGHKKPTEPPAHLDYDLWVGPAAWKPYQSNFVHYHWHWFYNFGTGDIGNDGVHGIDLARWGLGVETHPSFVSGYGSKLFFDDDQEFPDTYTITFEYPGDGTVGEKRLLIYEQRIWSPYRQDAGGRSVFFYGTQGMLALGRSGIEVFGPNNKPVLREELPDDESVHQRNFLEAIRGKGRLNADIEVGHLSSTLPHLGNIVSRTGRSVRFDPASEEILDDADANRLLGRQYRSGHWAVPEEA